MVEQFSKEIDLDNNNNTKLDRFAKISAKISQIKGTDSTNAQKVEKIEQKINTVEDTFNTNLDSLEQKYAILKDQLVKFSKLIEEDRANKEKAKSKTKIIKKTSITIFTEFFFFILLSSFAFISFSF